MPTPRRSWRRLSPWRWPAAAVHGVLALTLLTWAAWSCFGSAGSHGMAEATYDRLQQARLWASPPDARLLIVDIDERSLADMAEEFGRWPWPRDTLATLLDHAERDGAAAFVFDILFSDPDRLHPGGDRALETAAAASGIALFPAARLPARLDGHSELTADRLPGLATPPATGWATAPRLAMILPFMQAMVARGRLATHTAQRDPDGKLRRFAWHERLPDGWTVRSMPAAVARQLGRAPETDGIARRIVWRQQVDAYPRVPFVVAWACAEGRRRAGCPSLHGRIVVLGASASGLHDVLATPLSNQHAGVDILATLIDNALHARDYRELGSSWRFAFAAAALALAWWAVRRGNAGASRHALLLLPAVLMGLGYASLHTEAVYLDLTLPATLALSFISIAALFDALRCRWFGLRADDASGPFALACGAPSSSAEWLERVLLDIATREGLRVSGCRAASGRLGTMHGLWALWGLLDELRATQIALEMSRRVPGAWFQYFAPGSEPLQAWRTAADAGSKAVLGAVPGSGVGLQPAAERIRHAI